MADIVSTGVRGVLWRRGGVYASTLIGVLLIWEALSATGFVKPLLLASPASTWHALTRLHGVMEPVLTTLQETATAFGLALLVAVPLGLVIGSSGLLSRAYEPVLTSASALPLVVLFPVLVATFGIGSDAKVALGTLYAFFPMAIATLRATRAVDRRLLVAGRAMGASPAQQMRSVVFPAVLSPLLASMRVSLGLALVTVIAGEFISGAEGIGYELGRYSQLLDTPSLFAWIVIACALTIAVNITFTVATAVVQKGVTR